MTDEDNLRDRIVAKAALRARLGHVIDEALREKRRRYCECTTHEHVAQAIIDEFGMTVETGQFGVAMKRVVGKWAKQ